MSHFNQRFITCVSERLDKGVDNVGAKGAEGPKIFCILMLSMWINLQIPPLPDFFSSSSYLLLISNFYDVENITLII